MQLQRERRGQVAEFNGGFVFTVQESGQSPVGVDDGEVGPGDESSDGDAVKYAGEELMTADELVVQPAVFDGEPEFFEQVIDEQQFFVGEFAAHEPPAEDGDAEGAFAIIDRDGDLAAENFQFAQNFWIEKCRSAVGAGRGAKNLRSQGELAAESALAGEGETFDEFGRHADGGHAVERGIFRRRHRCHGFKGARFEKNCDARQTHHFAEPQNKMLRELTVIERVAEDL